MSPAARRELKTRNATWARTLAGALGRAGVRPNAVSVAGVGCAVVAGASFFIVGDAVPGLAVTALLSAAAAIQLRLLCNLLDGMLAVEEGFKTPIGEMYNDLPDRVADVVILVGAGYAIRHLSAGVALGWAAALAAVLTAYVRTLGGALGATQPFIGPMAKPHRMFTLTIAALLAGVETLLGLPPHALRVGLALIVAGSIVTLWRRTARVAGELRAQ